MLEEAEAERDAYAVSAELQLVRAELARLCHK